MRAAALAVLTLAAGIACAQERPGEHPYSATVQFDDVASHYRFAMPAQAYRGVSRRDLGDVRVFNAAGEPVPHAFAPREVVPPAPVTRGVNLFPVYGEEGQRVEATSVRVTRAANGAVVSVRTTSTPAPARRRVLAYIVDASAIEERQQALQLEWQASGGFSGQAQVEASDDLQNWRTVASGPVLLLEHAGARLERKRVELAGTRSKYLRLSFFGVPEDFVLKAIRVELRGEQGELVREWLPVPVAAGKEPGELLFDTAGRFPVDRIRLALPQINTVAQVQFLVRERDEDKWRPVGSATAYRLRGAGGEIVNPDIVLPSSTERYWLLRVDQKGGGFGAGEVRAEVGWLPHQLVFAARGEAPFRVAYGAKTARQGALAIGAVLPGYKDGDLKIARPARVGTPSGDAPQAASLLRDPLQYFRALAASGDGKKWLLWGLLLAGVLLLAWMAFRLLGEVGAKPSK